MSKRRMLSFIEFGHILKQSEISSSDHKKQLITTYKPGVQSQNAVSKVQGHGNRQRESNELTNADIENVFECSELGTETPSKVINLLLASFS